MDPTSFTNADGKTLGQHQTEQAAAKAAEFAAAERAGQQAMAEQATAYPQLDSAEEREILRLVSLAGPYRVLLAVAGALDTMASSSGRRRDWLDGARRQAQAQVVMQSLPAIAAAEGLAPVAR